MRTTDKIPARISHRKGNKLESEKKAGKIMINEKYSDEIGKIKKSDGRDGWLHLVILGGGHVGKALAALGNVMGYHITVMDDREEFACSARHPLADELVCAPFGELEKRIPEYDNCYYVIVTRGHEGDFVCADQILKRPFSYLGMIGSRSKAAAVRERLLKAGHDRKMVDQIHMPIGIRLGGGEPQEIAVSILAQIVQVKNEKNQAAPSQEVCRALEAGIPGVLVTIVEKSGSAPRGVGTSMYVGDDGTLYGTIGGGRMEYQAVCDAAQVGRSTVRKRYSLSNAEAGGLGMVCGGEILVEMERKG